MAKKNYQMVPVAVGNFSRLVFFLIFHIPAILFIYSPPFDGASWSCLIMGSYLAVLAAVLNILVSRLSQARPISSSDTTKKLSSVNEDLPKKS